MAKKKTRRTGLPPRVRAHGAGYRAVAVILGKRCYSPTFPTVGEAQEWLRTREVIVHVDGPLTLRGGLDLLLGDLAETNAAHGTRDFYERAHFELVQVFGADTRLDRLDAKAIRHYIDVRKRRGVGLQTIVQKELGTLRRIVRLAIVSGRLGRDPTAGVKLPRVRGARFNTIAAEEVERAIATIREQNQDHADIVELVWRTSMRRAEVARLRVRDIDLQMRTIYVHGKCVDRYRPIATQLVPAVERLVARATPDGRIVSSVRKVEKLFDYWRKKLGLAAFSPHVLRHGFASDLLNRGTPPMVVASLMGHNGLRMLGRYYHAGSALRDAVDSLGQDTPRRSTRPPDATGQDPQAPRS